MNLPPNVVLLFVVLIVLALALRWFRTGRPMTRAYVFRIIKKARGQVSQDQSQLDGDIKRVEHVVPFVDGDFSLSVWAFYATDQDVRAAEDDGRNSTFRSTYLKALREHGYDPTWLDKIGFTFDSVENVEANYEGSYFNRLR